MATAQRYLLRGGSAVTRVFSYSWLELSLRCFTPLSAMLNFTHRRLEALGRGTGLPGRLESKSLLLHWQYPRPSPDALVLKLAHLMTVTSQSPERVPVPLLIPSSHGSAWCTEDVTNASLINKWELWGVSCHNAEAVAG